MCWHSIASIVVIAQLCLPVAGVGAETSPAPGAEDSIEGVIEVRDSLLRAGPLSEALSGSWQQTRQFLLEHCGLKVALTYDALMMGAVGSDDDATGGSGDLTLNSHWQVFANHPDLMVLAMRLRDRHAFADDAPSVLGSQTGALWGFADGFTDHGLEVPELYFENQFFEHRLLFRYGQMSMDDLMDGHGLRSAKRSFLNQAFANNPAAGFPGYGLGMVANWAGDSGWDITAGVSSMESSNLSNEVHWRFSDSLFEALQVGYDFAGINRRPARVQLLGWNADALPDFDLPDGRGASLTLEQEWAERERSFVRYAWSDGEAAPVAQLIELGYARDIRRYDRLGLAVAAGQSSSASGDWQGVLELFYRWHLGQNLHITPDVQVVVGDGIAHDAGWLLVGGLRASIIF